MGGRGSSSGFSVDGKKYGTEYHTVLRSGNIKFVQRNDGASAKTPMETMTKGRIYVTVNNRNALKAVTFYDKQNKRYKQIDLAGTPHTINGEKVLPHTHFGYEHYEHGTENLSEKEQRLVAKINKLWYNKKAGSSLRVRTIT